MSNLVVYNHKLQFVSLSNFHSANCCVSLRRNFKTMLSLLKREREREVNSLERKIRESELNRGNKPMDEMRLPLPFKLIGHFFRHK